MVRFFPRVKSQGVALITHLHLATRLSMSSALYTSTPSSVPVMADYSMTNTFTV